MTPRLRYPFHHSSSLYWSMQEIQGSQNCSMVHLSSYLTAGYTQPLHAPMQCGRYLRARGWKALIQSFREARRRPLMLRNISSQLLSFFFFFLIKAIPAVISDFCGIFLQILPTLLLHRGSFVSFKSLLFKYPLINLLWQYIHIFTFNLKLR